MPATTEEMRQIEEDEADEEALSQAIETVLGQDEHAKLHKRH
jgi:hypothetical protein